MSLEAFIDIRFGDPVSSLSITYQGLVYGTMIGRIIYYDFYSKEERLISELSEEYIPGVHLSYDNTLYAAIGDLKALMVAAPEVQLPQKQYILHEKHHNSISCELTQVKMHEDLVLLFTLQPPADDSREIVHSLFLTQISTQVKKRIESIPFPNVCMPFDFDGHRLLWMDWNDDRERILNIYHIDSPPRSQTVALFPPSYGNFSFGRFLDQSIVFVFAFRKLMLMEIDASDRVIEIGRHKEDVVALSVESIHRVNRVDRDRRNFDGGLNEGRYENSGFEAPEPEEVIGQGQKVIISVDKTGTICVWSKGSLAEVLEIKSLPELKREYQRMKYFALGYPYIVTACGSRIAVSTDLGVLIIRSKFLESLMMP